VKAPSRRQLAISLVVAAAESGRRIYFGTLTDLILHDEVMAAALLDRCHIVNIRGNSFRMRRHMVLSRAIHPTASRALDAEKAQDGGES